MKVGPPRSGLHESEVGDSLTLYDATSEQVVVLNATASDVWRLCDGTLTSEEITALLAKAYHVDPRTVEHDVREAIEGFAEQELLEQGSEA